MEFILLVGEDLREPELIIGQVHLLGCIFRIGASVELELVIILMAATGIIEVTIVGLFCFRFSPFHLQSFSATRVLLFSHLLRGSKSRNP